jgi:hypothetical protein
MRIRDPGWKKVGSGINIPDPQHCKKRAFSGILCSPYSGWPALRFSEDPTDDFAFGINRLISDGVYLGRAVSGPSSFLLADHKVLLFFFLSVYFNKQ